MNLLIPDLIEEIEELCLENETARILLEENWPPAQTLPAETVLSQGCRASQEGFRSRMPISDTKLLSTPDVPGPFASFLEELIEAIRKTRQLTHSRIENLKKTLWTCSRLSKPSPPKIRRWITLSLHAGRTAFAVWRVTTARSIRLTVAARPESLSADR